jgi:hypothetical protein
MALEFLRQAYDYHERLKKFRRETIIEQKSEKGGG